MAIIAGTTINWAISPRVITIPAPVNELTIIDLQDTLTSLEDDVEGIVFNHLRNTSGGEILGGGVTVGWTMELQDAQVQFEARSTALDSGTCTTSDTNGVTLIDSAGTFITNSISRGDTVFNGTTGSMAAVLSVDSQTQLTCQVLSGGANAQWTSTDTYVIYDNQQCNISGGNISAVNALGNEISPVFESPNVNVVRTASSSATNSDAEAIQYSSYGKAVTIDVINGSAGTDYPFGNLENPVNNLVDALIIAEGRGFRRIDVRGNLTLDSGDWAEGYGFWGEDHANTTITVADPAGLDNCSFHTCKITGVMDDRNHVNDCIVLDLTSFDGMFHNCGFMGTITLGGITQTTVIKSYSMVAGAATPIFDMGGTSSAFVVRGYEGGLQINNKTGTDAVSLDINPGQLIVDSTVSAGTIVVRGSGKLTDNSIGTAVVDADDFLQAGILMDGVERTSFIGKEGAGVSIHPTTGTDSIVWPIGTRKTPCKTVQNAHDIAEAQGFRNIYAMENININSTMNDGYTFFGDNPNTITVNLDVSSSVNGGKFQDCTLTGQLSSANIVWESVVGAVTNLNGFIYKCALLGPLTVVEHTSINKCFASPLAPMATVTIDFNSVAKSVFISQWEQGIIKVMNMVTGSMIHMAGTGGRLTVDVSCTGGMVATGGAIMITNNGTQDILMASTIADQVISSDMGGQIQDTWQVMGLDAANAMTVTPTSRSVASITQQITGDAVTTSTVTRI